MHERGDANPQSGVDHHDDPSRWLQPGLRRVYPLPFDATVPSLLAHAVEEFGDRTFVITSDRRATFRDVDASSREIAAALVAHGAGKGTRVGLLLPNGIAAVEVILALARIGALAMPLSTFLAPAELRSVLRHGDVQILVVPPTLFGRDVDEILVDVDRGLTSVQRHDFRLPSLPYLRTVLVHGRIPGADVERSLLDAIEQEVDPADWLVTVFTSGTTSAPKAVVHTHGTLVRHSGNLAAMRELGPTDTMFVGMPFFWIGGLVYVLLAAMHSGCAIIVQERFDAPSGLDLIEAEQANVLAGWENVRKRLMADPSYPDRKLDGVPYLPPLGTPDADPDLRHQSLGMTETSGPHTAAPLGMQTGPLPEGHRGSWGPSVPFVEHRIAAFETSATLPDGVEGEICVRGYSVMAGMYKREREDVFDADGWYHTGDRGFFRDGLLFFTGRGDDQIKTGGSNVAPREVEAALLALPEIDAAFVFGIDDEERSQSVVAGVVPTPGAIVDPDAVRDRLRKEISVYKVPREIAILDDADVPLLASGKEDRRAVRDAVVRKLGEAAQQ